MTLVLVGSSRQQLFALTEIVDPNQIITRTYPLPPRVYPLRQDTAKIKKWFEEQGVQFPEGTGIAYDDSRDVLVITHKVGAEEQIRDVLKKANLIPADPFITIEVRFLQMPRTLAEDLFENEGGLSQAEFVSKQILEQIHKHVRSGKITELARPKLTTVSGNTAQVKSTREVKYPNDFSPPTDATVTNVISPRESWHIGAFEIREVGCLLNVTPIIGPDGTTINLTLVPEISSVARKPRQYPITTPAGKVTVEQPEFLCYQTTTTVVLKSGNTMLLSVLDPVAADGKLSQDDVVFILLSATVVRE